MLWYTEHNKIKKEGCIHNMRETVSLKKQYEIIDNSLRYRIHHLLPKLMKECGIDLWVILCREYNEDPVFRTMIPSLCLTARRLSCLVFVNGKDGFGAYNFGRPDERLAKIYTQGYTDTKKDQMKELAAFIREQNPAKIAVNTSKLSGICDGLSKELYDQLYEALEETDREKLCSAYPLATRWIEARTEEELSRYRTVYALAMNICEEAFSRKVITPGVTTTTEVEEWIAQEINRLGLTFWFSPHVDIQRKGMPGVGSCGDIIQHGDLLHYDVGITYFGLCSDSQRLGYVLREEETEVPDYLRKGLEVTNRFQDIVAQEHIAGRTGNEILKSSLERAKQEGIRAMLYCHPIGFYGHSAGTVVGLWDKQEGTGAYGDFPLHYNTCYALELNTESTVAEWDNQLVRFCAEETVSFTDDGKLCYLYPGREKIFAI